MFICCKLREVYTVEPRYFERRSNSLGLTLMFLVIYYQLFRTRLFGISRYFELIVLSLHLKYINPVISNLSKTEYKNKLPSDQQSNRDCLTLQFVCCWGSQDSTANKPVVIHDRQKYKKKTKNSRTFKEFSMQQRLLTYPTYNHCIFI